MISYFSLYINQQRVKYHNMHKEKNTYEVNNDFNQRQ